MQDFFHYNRPKEIEFKKGSNWVSITHELLTIILAQKSFILRRFKNVCCGDEIFLQSILWNSERRSHIYPGSEQLNAGLRAIDWERGESLCLENGGFAIFIRNRAFVCSKI